MNITGNLLHVLKKYFEAMQISAMPPLMQGNPLYAMAQLNELSSSTILLGQQCMHVESEEPVLFFPVRKRADGNGL